MKSMRIAIAILAIALSISVALNFWQYNALIQQSNMPYIVTRTFNYTLTYGGASYERQIWGNGSTISENITFMPPTIMQLIPVNNATRITDTLTGSFPTPLTLFNDPYIIIMANSYSYTFNDDATVTSKIEIPICIGFIPSDGTLHCNGSYPITTSWGTVSLVYFNNASYITFNVVQPSGDIIIDSFNVTLPP